MEATAIDNIDMVDPFLVEALQNQNPRQRLTILQMELAIQKFLHNQNQLQFEFQHFPTSYLRLAAHRVAQHYGMQTMVQDNGLDGLGSKILVIKTADSKYPAVCLTEIPAKQTENDKPENVKIAIKHRPNRVSGSDGNDGNVKLGILRSFKEREEEYDKVRARIFSSPSSPQADDVLPQAPGGGKNNCTTRDENEICRNTLIDLEKSFSTREGNTSSRAIIRDREKDLTDPDYDRNYGRYTRNTPRKQSFNLMPSNMQKFPFVQQETGFSHFGHIPGTQPAISYRPLTSPVMGPLSAQAYVQWPNATVMYPHSNDQIRQGVFQVPFHQQPLSFDYSQNH